MIYLFLILAFIALDLVVGTLEFRRQDRSDRIRSAEKLGLIPEIVCDDKFLISGFSLPVFVYREFIVDEAGARALGPNSYLKTWPKVKFGYV